MPTDIRIARCHAREVLDSRGFPTIEVVLSSASHEISAIVPSGASTGEGEALELRDGDKNRYLGKGVLKAVRHVCADIGPAIVGRNFQRQVQLDDFLIELDGTENKTKFGANAILGVSMAFARLLAREAQMPLYASLAQSMGASGRTLPLPLMNVLNGGKHADNGLAIQEFMIVPHGFSTFSDSLRAGVETFHALKSILSERSLATSVGDEGGFAPKLGVEGSHRSALILLMEAIERAGYKPGEQISLALDVAASEFAKTEKNSVVYDFEDHSLRAAELIEVFENWATQFPLVSIEDGLSEHDWSGWKLLTQKLGKRMQLIGDDLFVTNPKILARGIQEGVGNAILIKLNQIGTVTETIEAIRLAQKSGYRSIVSHRSGESEDTFIADLAVGSDAGQIKTGSASRSDRTSKYNQLLRIEEQLGAQAEFTGKKIFKK
jgi:enolase